MDRGTMRIEAFLIVKRNGGILIILSGDIKRKHFRLLGSNIENITVDLNTIYILNLLGLDLSQVLGKIEQGISSEVLA